MTRRPQAVDSSRQPWRQVLRQVAPLLGSAVGVSLLLWLPTFREVFLDRDEAVYAVVARSWADGLLPYLDVFDHKPPVIYVIYRAVFAVCGESLAALRGVFAVMTGLSGFTTAMVLRSAIPATPVPLLWVAALAVVYLQAGPALSGGTANCEVPMVLFVVTAALAALKSRQTGRRQWLAATGIASSLALLTKPVCLPEVALIALVALWRVPAAEVPPPRRLAGIFAFAGALAAPLLAIGALFASRPGGLEALREAVVDYNLHYAASAPVSLAESSLFLLQHSATTLGPFLAGWLLLAWLAARGRAPAPARWFLLWLALAAVGALSSGRPYLHYLQQLAVPLVCATVVAITLLLEERPRRARSRTGAALGVIFTLAMVPSIAATFEHLRGYLDAANWESDVGRMLSARLGSSETVATWGAIPAVYYFSGARPASRFIYKYPIVGDSPFAEKARRRFHAEVLAARPGAIVVARDDVAGESATRSDEEWLGYWTPAFEGFLDAYRRILLEDCIVYLRRGQAGSP